jgi:plasmid stability protein
MPDILIRNLPPDLHHRLKVVAAKAGKPMRQIIEDAIREKVTSLETRQVFHAHPTYSHWCGDTTGIPATNPKDVDCPKCLARAAGREV